MEAWKRVVQAVLKPEWTRNNVDGDGGDDDDDGDDDEDEDDIVGERIKCYRYTKM